MMTLIRYLSVVITSVFLLASAAAAEADASYIYPTKLGNLKFVRADGTVCSGAEKLMLNEQVLLSVEGEQDKQGEWLSVMADIMTSTSRELEPQQQGQKGAAAAKRMVILIGQGTCVKHLVILDFTGPKPFISNRFGNNQQDRLCLTFKKAKWGKKESEIMLSSGASYLYTSYGDVTGPFAFE